jgi:hypothetical protein
VIERFLSRAAMMSFGPLRVATIGEMLALGIADRSGAERMFLA